MIQKNIYKKLLYAFVCVFCVSACVPASETNAEKKQTVRSLESKLGTKFTKVKDIQFKSPTFNHLNLLTDAPGTAILGAIGRDDTGNIYFGASTYRGYHDNAYVYQFNPKTKVVVAQSSVIEQLKRAHLYKEGMSQSTLHSKFYLADDGYLYFTSMDSFSSKIDLASLSKSASFLWRKKPNDINWEHVLSTREDLVSVQTDGRYVYVLGNPNHVLYQFDTLSRRIKRVAVGSVGTHTSRHFLVSPNGRIFVPKVQKLADNTIVTDLLEYDSNLNVVDTHPLRYYYDPKKYNGHGIVSYSHMKNNAIYFVTGQGALYKIEEIRDLKHEVTFTHFFDENNTIGNFIPSLFTLDGQDFLVGLGKEPSNSQHQWFIHEISTNTTVKYNLPELDKNLKLSGSVTRDNMGNMYVAGVDVNDASQNKAVILQLSFPSK